MSDEQFDEAFGFDRSTTSSRNCIPETQYVPDPNIIPGTEQDDAVNAMMHLKSGGRERINDDGYNSADVREYEEEYGQPPSPPAKFSSLSSASHESSASRSSQSDSNDQSSLSSYSSASSVGSLPMTTSELKKKREVEAVARKRERRRVVEVTPIFEPGTTSRAILEQRRSSSAGEHIDLQEEGGDERGGRGGRKKSKGKGKGRMEPVPEFSDISSSPESLNSVSIENRVDRLVVAFIASKKCMNAKSKRVMIQRFIREPALTHFSPVRAVHVSDIFIRNEDSAAKASRWNLAFVSTALFRLSKVIQQANSHELF